eukprot:TRINITY_DN1680_c0_g1_i2.p1 TRINITY_DN1680_c0_g1~~TRINITY_DN1680_c0_g1_i2.p1  ORF type:complete len:429 (+),score=160.66 TRINITY_DN1680_c0_g1_i2:194-1480(+)
MFRPVFMRLAVLPCPPVAPSAKVAPLPVEAFEEMRQKLLEQEGRREQVHQYYKELSRKASQASHMLGYGEVEKGRQLVEEVEAGLAGLPAELKEKNPGRDGRISKLVEKQVGLRAQLEFYSKCRLVRKGELEVGLEVEDTEYLVGVIDFVADLAAYGMRRGTHGDVRSVAIARDLGAAVLALLMEFNFRGGSLRHKYDSVKWSVKRLTDLLYELSKRDGGEARKYAEEGSSGVSAEMMDLAEMKEVQGRVEAFDKDREMVMRSGRGEAQKLAKQSIFTMHRGELKKGREQVEGALAVAKKAHEEYVVKTPALRTGSFADCLEEIAEAMIFLVWMETGSVPPPSSIPLVEIDEYLGGLIDFTGEVGRYAVLNATKRDVQRVEDCFAVTLAITEQVTLLPNDGRLGKKLETLKNNTKKIENLLFELSISA